MPKKEHRRQTKELARPLTLVEKQVLLVLQLRLQQLELLFGPLREVHLSADLPQLLRGEVSLAPRLRSDLPSRRQLGNLFF